MEPLFVRIAPELNDYVDQIKQNLKINKSDFISFLLVYARRFWTEEQIKDLYDRLLMLGEEGIEQVA